jgi:predicted AAA+ superfamily ATPase
VSFEYLPRVVDVELDGPYAGLPAVSIDGPKGVGKTVTASRRAGTVLSLDDETQRELLAADHSRLERSAPPVVVDEWQRYPAVWDMVRRSVDRDGSARRFILTGSASPVDAPLHSGAGRIVRLRMRPMALAERRLAPTTVSLAELLSGTRPVVDGDCDLTAMDYAEEIIKSGFPAIRTLPAPARRLQLDGYLDQIVQHDFPEQGLTVRRPAALRNWLRAYAAATATTTSYETITDAATPGQQQRLTRPTTTAYRDVLAQIWLLDQVPGWLPTHNYLSRLATAPKHHLADPALAARLLGVGAPALLQGDTPGPPVLRNGPLLGTLFESLVTLSVRVYAQAVGASVHHLRTRSGDHEIDLILERDDGRVVALEVKLNPSVDDDVSKNLRWLREKIGADLLDAAVITTGPHAYRRQDGIAVIPAGLLGI